MVSPEATAPVVFDDATGKVAILLRERSGKSKKFVNLICLYDKKSGKASIAEYQWLGQ
jgi:aromatic ring-cleaving dioxygenase